MNSQELAARAGVEPALVDRLNSLGIITAGDEGFSGGDVYRVRFVLACEQAGMSADALAKGIAAGKISLAFMDLPHYRWSTLATTTYGELATESGLHATAGQTLVSGEVATLTAGDAVRFQELGPVELKGFAKPIPLYEAVSRS